MKEIWVHLDGWSKEMATTALEGGADALVLPEGFHEKVKALGRIVTVSPDGDMKPGEDVFFEPLRSPQDEARIAKLLEKAPVVVERDEPGDRAGAPFQEPASSRGWEVIPLENLVAGGGRLFVPVSSKEELELAYGILEKGVSGVVIHAQTPGQLRTMLTYAKTTLEKEALQEAVIERIQPSGMGDRVCVDTCSLMEEGEGLLVGNSSGFLFLVQAETKENPYVAPRPFRVNAGPVHAYVRVPDGRTRYLSELQAGDRVTVFRSHGDTREATVGRVKIERRPILLIEAVCNGIRGSILLQNAETIRLTAPNGKARSIVDLKPGDSVLVALEEAGRHFGMKIDETIQEK